MASKKKSKGGLAPLRKAVAGIERAQRELQLNIKNLKAAMGHIHTPGEDEGKGHPHGAGSGRMKGHPHGAASGRMKGHPHTA
jgi:hypothetical protein